MSKLEKQTTFNVFLAIALLPLIFLFLGAAPVANQRLSVMADSNGTLLAPTNLFVQNSNLLNGAVGYLAQQVTNHDSRSTFITNLTVTSKTNTSLNANQFTKTDANKNEISTLNGNSLTNLALSAMATNAAFAQAGLVASSATEAAWTQNGSGWTNVNGTNVFGNVTNALYAQFGTNWTGLSVSNAYLGIFTGNGAALTNIPAIGIAQEVVTNTGTGYVIGARLTAAGTNNFPAGSDIAFGRYANASLANGANAGVLVGTNTFIDVSGPSADFTICGLDGGPNRNGKFIILLNATGYNMTLAHQSGIEPTAGNRIISLTGADQVTVGNGAAMLIYSSTSSRWILLNFAP